MANLFFGEIGGNMTLEEVVYQIDGELEIVNNATGCEAVLRDKIGSPAMVHVISDRKKVETRATGTTPGEAKYNLVKLLRGNIVKHEWPVMWTSSTASLRIPDTLVVSNHMNFVSAD